LRNYAHKNNVINGANGIFHIEFNFSTIEPNFKNFTILESAHIKPAFSGFYLFFEFLHHLVISVRKNILANQNKNYLNKHKSLLVFATSTAATQFSATRTLKSYYNRFNALLTRV